MRSSDFERFVCGADWYRPEGQIVATCGDKWIGLAAVSLLPKAKRAHDMMTGVVKEYRGRKIALALRLCAIGYARKNGARFIRTHNYSLDAPMLAINRRLGYKPGQANT